MKQVVFIIALYVLINILSLLFYIFSFSSDGKIDINKYPIFQYTVNGKSIEVKSVIGYSTSDYVVGQKVEIFYNPNKEDEIYIEK